jgi:hypothetical protein
VTGQTQVAMIDMSHCAATRRITHRERWQPGNDEDGYLKGLDNLIGQLEELSSSLRAQ